MFGKLVLLPYLLLLAVHLPWCASQFPEGGVLFANEYAEAQSSLVEQLENAPGLEDVYFPRKYSLPTDYYVFQPPDRELNYTQDVIFAPCQGYEYNCCNNTYGLPQFESVDAATESAAAQTLLLNADGSVLSNEYSRKPTFGLVMNEQCTDAGIPFPECYMARVASTQPLATPACWNRNASMVGDAPCRAPSDGTLIPFCMELAFAQNAYVFECGGVYESDPHCGTFLEVHRSGRPEILSDTHLKAQFTSGYHMTLLSTTYQRHNDRVLCYDLVNEGAHEVWWVMRTRYNFVVQKILPFAITSPLCDWDAVNNRYQHYATIATMTTLTVSDSFDQARYLFSRPRIEGKDGQPGRGMGALYVAPQPNTYPTGARMWQDGISYAYTPDKPNESVRKGIVEPTDTSLDGIDHQVVVPPQ